MTRTEIERADSPPAPAPAPDEFEYDPSDGERTPDPLEPMNRVFFSFNRGLDRLLIRPLSKAYGFVTPAPARRAVQRFLANLGLPVVMANDVLQLRARAAAKSTSRFVVNTVVGVLGLFDPATRWGLESRSYGFGKTLAQYGMPGGPYLVLPLFGPGTARHTLGNTTDLLFRPETYFLGLAGPIMVDAGTGVTERHERKEEIDEFEASSVDLYASVREAYLMSRRAQLDAAFPPLEPALDSDEDSAQGPASSPLASLSILASSAATSAE